MADKTLFLVCNSHIDPAWLWPWEEGVGVTLSTFRSAADLCQEFDGFVFCHNEALLYSWVEQYEPALFERIRRLVREGRWHVMGGWYLQPDCNIPSGESFVRQALVGKRWFMEKLGVEPRVAVNLDPFGHARGLVQILAKSGYDGYLFCRPDRAWLELPSDDFVWVGYDGSSVLAHRAAEHYNSELGKAAAKVGRWLDAHHDEPLGMMLWGVGNHGGGPSRQDLRTLEEIIASGGLSAGVPSGQHAGHSSQSTWRIAHGTPEDYFDSLREDGELPRHARDLNPWAVGCYTSMATVKRAHARLERGLFVTESMLANAALQGLLPYPRADLRASLEDLLFCQFHDVLPGEGVREVEQQALDQLGHGSEIVGRLRCRAFFAFLSGQPAAAEGEYPLFVHNHHAFPVEHTVSCEFQPPEPNANPSVFWQPRITDAHGFDVPLQLEKESCNIQNDQRKRVVFRASLPPACTARFSCRLEEADRNSSNTLQRPAKDAQAVTDHRCPRDFSPVQHVQISAATGLLSRFEVDGVPYLSAPAFRPLLMRDTADPWGMKTRAFRDVVGEFTPMSPAEAAAFAGVSAATLEPVRVIERGPVRTTIESLLSCGRSALVIRYVVPASGSEIEVEVRVSWFERDRMLKLAVPTTHAGGEVRAQTAYGVEVVRPGGEEAIGHRWLAILSPDGARALTIVNDSTYGFDVMDGEIRLSLLRAPAYAGHPVDDVTPIVRQDRFEPRVDQGEHLFRFWLNAGPADGRLQAIDREAAVRTEGLMALCAFPSGGGPTPASGVTLDDEVVRLSALKLSEDGNALVLRLFEPTGARRHTRVRVPALHLDFPVTLRPFELRTLLVDRATHEVRDADLLERVEARR
jgi:alpha-mannosidase